MLLLFLLNVVVDNSLKNTTLQVIVMEGQLDVICNTGGSIRELSFDMFFHSCPSVNLHCASIVMKQSMTRHCRETLLNVETVRLILFLLTRLFLWFIIRKVYATGKAGWPSVFSRASRMLRVMTQVVRMSCVCRPMYACVCVEIFFRTTPQPLVLVGMYIPIFIWRLPKGRWWRPVKFADYVCRHRQERTLLFALAFDSGLADRKFAFKILNSGIPAILFTNLVYKFNNLKVYAVKTSNFCRDLTAILR